MAAMSISGALFVALSGWFFWRQPLPELNRFYGRSALLWTTLALFAAGVWSLIWAKLDPPLGIPLGRALELPKKFIYFVYPFLIAYTLVRFSRASKKSLEELPFWKVLFWMSAFVALLGWLQFFASWILPKEWITGRFFRPVPWSLHHHAQGLMFFHLSYATVLCFTLAYSLARFFWRRPQDSKGTWLACGALAFVSGVAIYSSFSRISWLAIAAAVFLLGFLRRKQLGISLLLLGGICSLSLWVLAHDFRQRALDVVGMEGRVIVWKASWAMVKDRPLSGVGFGKTGQFSEEYAKKVFGKEQWFASHAHNNLLDALASTGILGLVAHILWWLVVLRYAWLAYRSTPLEEKWLPAGCLAAGVAFLVNGLTQVNFFDAKSQHALMLWTGLVLALEWRRRRQLADQSI